MELTDVKINEGEILNVKYTEYGRVYIVSVDGEKVNICARYYDPIARFMSNEYGLETEHVKGKNITLISDDERLLALKSKGSTIAFIPDVITEDCLVANFSENVDYIKRKYNLTPQEFIEIARELINQKRLKKEHNE